jgi:hypothetical protein
VTVLRYFIFVYSMNCAYQCSMKIWFCNRMARDKSLSFIISAYKNTRRRAKVFNKVFSRRLCNLIKSRTYRGFLSVLMIILWKSNCVISSQKQKWLLATLVDRLYLFHEYLEYHRNIHSHLVELFPVRITLEVRISKYQRKLLNVTGLVLKKMRASHRNKRILILQK